MPSEWNAQRRRFLEAAAGAAALPAVSCSRSAHPWRSLTPGEAETAAALCDCLIPPDEFPGAAWAGAVIYIDRQLAGHLRRYRPVYRDGLAAVDRASVEKFGSQFTGISEEQRVELLKLIEKGKAPPDFWLPSAQQQFFALILAHTMQSYYGDPRHGGNRERVGYRSLGIAVSPVRGREQHDISRGETRGKL